ncbi:MAG: DUF5652 family protein [Candidatus Pacearchaeota archaeon]
MVDTTNILSGTDPYSVIGNYLGISATAILVLFIIVSIWTLIWKGLALWKSANKNNKIWFVIFLIVNTVGILEILYIYVFSKMNLGKTKSVSRKKKKR